MKFRFGKYKGVDIEKVPDDYLDFLLNKNILKGRIMCYAKERLKYPKETFKVVVTDSIGTDGEYLIEAYTEKQAINLCSRNINGSQKGTYYEVKKLNVQENQ